MKIQNNTSDIQQFRRDLFRDLRAELGHLKTCQTSLMVFTSTGTGIFFGLVGSSNPPIPVAYIMLFPLFFLLPLWIIFYDKARSIARIIGFLRLQEKLYLLESPEAIIGWESAMEKYQQMRHIWNDRHLDRFFKEEKDQNGNTGSGREPMTSIYWFWVFCTFSLLTVTCLVLSAIFLPVDIIWKLPVILAIVIIAVIASRILELERIGRDNTTIDKRRSRKQPEHTDFKIFSGKAGILAALFLIIFWSLLIVLSLFISITGSPERYLFGYQILNLTIPGRESLFWAGIAPAVLYGFFLAFFIYAASIASWMFLNLVKGRYTYFVFRKRWQIILSVYYNDGKNTITPREWQQVLENEKKQESSSPAT